MSVLALFVMNLPPQTFVVVSSFYWIRRDCGDCLVFLSLWTVLLLLCLAFSASTLILSISLRFSY